MGIFLVNAVISTSPGASSTASSGTMTSTTGRFTTPIRTVGRAGRTTIRPRTIARARHLIGGIRKVCRVPHHWRLMMVHHYENNKTFQRTSTTKSTVGGGAIFRIILSWLTARQQRIDKDNFDDDKQVERNRKSSIE